ncbi:MAG: hypothetical protein PHE43_03140 [Candidatus Nanoarchaeia archaeon]|nr:hypothetical protein [Candidatus Nanoarchaeia archaeon]
MTYILETLPGLESSLEKETKGKIIAPCLIESKTKNSKIAYVISELIEKIKFKDEQDLLNQINKIEFKIEKDFFVNCKDKELAKKVGEIIFSKGFKANPKTEKIIYIYLDKNLAILVYLLVQNNEKRDYRFKRHNQSIDSCIANALIQESEIKENNSLIDPFCKDSVIPIEAFNHNIKMIYSFDNENNIRNSRINSKLAKAKINLEEKNIKDITQKADFCLTTLPIISKKNTSLKYIELFFNIIPKLVKTIGLVTFNPEITKDFCKKHNLKIKKEINLKKGTQNIYIFILKY